MSKSLRVLFVDDSEDDTLLLLRELRKGGYLIEWQRVQTIPAINAALEQGGWDMLLLDYNLPGFCAPDVLRLTQLEHLDIPVIVISGTMGEEVAVEVMQAGAHDYILKDRLTRLIPAVERELEEMKVHHNTRQLQSQLSANEERFRQMTESIDESFSLIDIQDMTVLYISPAFEAQTELPCDWLRDHKATRLLELVHPEDHARIEAQLAKDWAQFNEEFRILRPSGEERWLHVRHFPVRDSEGVVTRIAAVSQDITERKRLQQEMEKMLRVLEQTADMVLVTDREGIIEYVNPAFENITGFNRNEALGCKPSILKSGFQDDHYYARIWKSLEAGMPFSDIFINRRKDGELYYESKTITPIRDFNGAITHYVSTGNDITERLLAQERFQKMVNYDTVTGLASRILLMDRLEQALLEARRRSLQVALLLIRISLSDLIGDIRDRATGERLLRALAQRLREAAGDGATVARLSADEFVVMQRRCESHERVELLAQEILTAFSHPVEADGYRVFVSPAIGISVYPEDADETDQMLQHAASALSRVHQGVKESYQFYQHGMAEKKGRRPN